MLAKAVQSPNPPYIAHVLPIKDSTRCPIVIRDGKACGLTIMSGRIPSAVVGISASSSTIPIVPFCPALLANLSPIAGIRMCLTLTFARRPPSSSLVMKDLSIYPIAPFFGLMDSSTYASELVSVFVAIPINIVLSFITVFSLIMPDFESKLL